MKYFYGQEADGTIISIYDVAPDKKGRACNCVCPVCKSELLACSLDINNKQVRHFRHYRDIADADCSATKANESALHKMAKDVFAEGKKLAVPSYEIRKEEVALPFSPYLSSHHLLPDIPASFAYIDREKVEFSDIVLEPSMGTFIPDAIAHMGGERWVIEFAVSHFVDTEKRLKIQDANLPAVEVDLSGFAHQAISRIELQNAIFENFANKTWIHHPCRKDAMAAAQAYYQAHPAVCNYLQEQEKREIEQRKREERERVRRQKGAYWKQLQDDSDSYKQSAFRLKNDGEFWRGVHTTEYFRFFHDHKTVPDFIGIPILGDIVFACDRRIWQGIIFNRYIYTRRNARASINLDNIPSDLEKVHRVPLDSRLPDWLKGEVVHRYLKYLAFLGFIQIRNNDENWATVLQRGAIIPSDQKRYQMFTSFLKTLDPYDPKIDSRLDNYIRQHQYHTQPRFAYRTERTRPADPKPQPSDFDQEGDCIMVDGLAYMKCVNCGVVAAWKDFPIKIDARKGRCRNCLR